jgi:hypothetical protein
MTHSWRGRLVLPVTKDGLLKAYTEDMSKMIPSSPMGPRLTHGTVTASTMRVKNQAKLDTTQQKNDQQFNDDDPAVDIGSTTPKPLKLSVVLDNLLTKAKKQTVEQRSERLFGPELSHKKVMKNYERYVRIRQKLSEAKDKVNNVQDKGDNVQNSTNSGDLFKTTRHLYSRAMKKCAGTSVAIPGPGGEPMDLIKEEGKKHKKKKNMVKK